MGRSSATALLAVIVVIVQVGLIAYQAQLKIGPGLSFVVRISHSKLIFS